MAANKSQYEAVLADLEAERARLDQAIGVLRRQLGKDPLPPAGGDGGSGDARPASGSPIPRNAFSSMSLPESIKAYLRAANERQTPKQIHDGIVRGGFHTTAKKLYANVYTTLLRLEGAGEAVKVDNAWGLAEWYPGMRRSGKIEKAVDKLVAGDRTAEETVDDLAAGRSEKSA
jgi:hypothetical protein